MKTLTKKNSTARQSAATYLLLLAFLSFFNIPLLQAAQSAAPEISGELRTWHKITLTFDGPASRENASPNPFLDYRMDVTFTSGNTTYIVPGYYAADGNAASTSLDNGNKWRVHFAPDKEGTWTYKVSFRKGANVAVDNNRLAGSSAGYFDGTSGSLYVSATNKTSKDNRGKGRLQYVGEHFLRYAGTGEYFVKGGADAPENFLSYADFDGDFKTDGIKDELVKTWSAHISDWRTGDPSWKGGKGKGMIGALNYLSSKGINAFSFLTLNINGDDRNVYPYTNYNEKLRFDCSKLDQWEIIFEHADKLGLYLHFKLQEEENERLLDDGNVGVQRKLYYRELIARFSHHLALNWNFGEENGPTVNAQTDAQRKAMGQYFSQYDPYHHLKVLHTRPGQQETVYAPLLGNGQYLDGTSLQVDYNKVHEETLKWVKRSVSAGHKWVVANDEQGDSSTGVKPDGTDNNHDAIRKYTLWGNLMAGGAGVEYYFGYRYAHSDLTCQDWRSRDNMWNYTNHALSFFREHIPFWEMNNANSLLTSNNGYCLGQNGQVYVVYLTNGGSAKLNLAGINKTFAVTWYNPRDGKFDAQSGMPPNSTIQGGAEVTLGNPPRDTQQDWVILLKVSSETNVSPTIALTAPANNATYTAGNDITLNATANDQDGSVAKVAFYAGSTRLGEDATAPYTFTWKGSAAGAHQIKAVATDNQGSEAFASNTITVTDGSNCPTTFVEKNGLVVIETESVSSMPGGWTKKTSTSGYTGSGYLEWTGSDSFSTPGAGTMTYKFQITKTGTYRFVWRNLIAKGSSSTDYNDTWLKFPDASDFYGKRDTHIVYPKGSGKSPNPNGAGAGGWFKIYTNAKGWNWQTTTSDNDPHHIYAKFDAPGIYSLQISGRSNGHAIDRLVLHHADVSTSLATQTGNPETRCNSTAPAPSNIPPTVSITSPANNTVVEVGSKVVVSAQAADQDGQIQVVKFYQGQTLMTQDTSAPYSCEITNKQAGDYVIKVVAVDNQGATTTSSPITISFKEPVSQPVTPAAIRLTLINAVTDQPIAGYDPMTEGAVINLAQVGKDLAIVANISGIDGVPPSSVKFSYNGNDTYQIENIAPYAIAGDNSGDYNSWTPSLGNKQVTATAYSGSRATGEVLAKISISFQVVEQTITLPPAPVQEAITFTLYNAVTDQPVAGYDPIAEGAVINLAKVGKDLNIVAKVNGITSVASLKFGYNGNASYHTENFAPYAIGMDDSGNLRSWTPAAGSNQLSATAYSGARATGEVLAKASISFQVINNASLVNARNAGLPADKANSQNGSLPTDKAGYSISTYPNPAVDEITVAVNTVVPKAFGIDTENFMAGTYAIRDIQGHVVAQGVLPRTADGTNQITIGVRNLKRGIYFLHIYVYGEHSSVPGRPAVEKIIIDK